VGGQLLFGITTVILVQKDTTFATIVSQKDGIIAEKDTQISGLHDRISEYESKLKVSNPDQAVGELSVLREQLNETKARLNSILNPPRDNNSIYQNGNRIGIAAGAEVDSAKNTVKFQAITVAGQIDLATNIEFRSLVLSYIGADIVSQQRSGLVGNTTYGNARFAIVGHRAD
jgi:hypothetical protein